MLYFFHFMILNSHPSLPQSTGHNIYTYCNQHSHNYISLWQYLRLQWNHFPFWFWCRTFSTWETIKCCTEVKKMNSELCMPGSKENRSSWPKMHYNIYKDVCEAFCPGVFLKLRRTESILRIYFNEQKIKQP